MSPIRTTAKADSNASRRMLLIIAICLFIVALSLVIIQSVSPKGFGVRKTYANGYEDGFRKARELAASVAPGLNDEVRTLNGSVVSVGTNMITVDAHNLVVDESVDGVGRIRTVNIDEKTQIIKRTPRDERELQRLIESVIINPRDEEPPALPSTYNEESIALKDVPSGANVTVVPAGEMEDLRSVKTFTASKIFILVPVPDQDVRPANQ